jgi:hypothetical protein
MYEPKFPIRQAAKLPYLKPVLRRLPITITADQVAAIREASDPSLAMKEFYLAQRGVSRLIDEE